MRTHGFGLFIVILKLAIFSLDAEMNPKISDFGMVRIFELDQNEGSTNKIVGT